MTTYVIFLRAINTGNRRVKMADLRAAFSEAGFDDPQTHIASGNVIVRSTQRPDRATVEAAVSERFGWESEAFIRSHDELLDVLRRVPWSTDEWLVEVSFLEAEADAEAAKELEALAIDPEAIAVSGSEVFYRRIGKGVETLHKEKTTMQMLDQLTTRRGIATVKAIVDKYASGA